MQITNGYAMEQMEIPIKLTIFGRIHGSVYRMLGPSMKQLVDELYDINEESAFGLGDSRSVTDLHLSWLDKEGDEIKVKGEKDWKAFHNLAGRSGDVFELFVVLLTKNLTLAECLYLTSKRRNCGDAQYKKASGKERINGAKIMPTLPPSRQQETQRVTAKIVDIGPMKTVLPVNQMMPTAQQLPVEPVPVTRKAASIVNTPLSSPADADVVEVSEKMLEVADGVISAMANMTRTLERLSSDSDTVATSDCASEIDQLTSQVSTLLTIIPRVPSITSSVKSSSQYSSKSSCKTVSGKETAPNSDGSGDESWHPLSSASSDGDTASLGDTEPPLKLSALAPIQSEALEQGSAEDQPQVLTAVQEEENLTEELEPGEVVQINVMEEEMDDPEFEEKMDDGGCGVKQEQDDPKDNKQEIEDEPKEKQECSYFNGNLDCLGDAFKRCDVNTAQPTNEWKSDELSPNAKLQNETPDKSNPLMARQDSDIFPMSPFASISELGDNLNDTSPCLSSDDSSYETSLTNPFLIDENEYESLRQKHLGQAKNEEDVREEEEFIVAALKRSVSWEISL